MNTQDFIDRYVKHATIQLLRGIVMVYDMDEDCFRLIDMDGTCLHTGTLEDCVVFYHLWYLEDTKRMHQNGY